MHRKENRFFKARKIAERCSTCLIVLGDRHETLDSRLEDVGRFLARACLFFANETRRMAHVQRCAMQDTMAIPNL